MEDVRKLREAVNEERENLLKRDFTGIYSRLKSLFDNIPEMKEFIHYGLIKWLLDEMKKDIDRGTMTIYRMAMYLFELDVQCYGLETEIKYAQIT